jgi:hypothetical protein
LYEHRYDRFNHAIVVLKAEPFGFRAIEVKETYSLTLASAAFWAQVDAGEQKPEASLPVTTTTVSTLNCPGGWPSCPMAACLPSVSDAPAQRTVLSGHRGEHQEKSSAAMKPLRESLTRLKRTLPNLLASG